MAKRKLFEEPNLTGYLTDMTEVKMSASGKTKYFTGTLQTSKSEMQRLVCFTPEKHAEFMRASNMQSPVKLKQHMLKPGREGTIEVHITKATTLEISDQPLLFRKTASTAQTTSQKVKEVKVTDLTKEDMLVTVDVKFLKFSSPEKTAHTRFGDKTMRTGIVADATNAINLNCWEKMIPLFLEGQSYKIHNVVTKKFDGNIILNTTASTTINDIPALEDVVQHTTDTMATKTVAVNQIIIKSTTRCSNAGCAKPIDLQNATDLTVRCPRCFMKQKTTSLRRHVIAHMNCTEQGQSQDLKYVMFEEAIMNILTAENKEHLINDTDLLEDFFLEIPFFHIEHSMNSDVLQVCSVSQDI